MANVELSVDANLQGLRRQLESIPGMTAEQARLMTAELNKSIRASEKAAKQAADASKRAMEQAAAGASRAAGAVDNLGDRFGKVGSNSAKLAGALGMVNPGLADMARNVADLADVGEVGASFGGIATALGAVAAVAGLFLAGFAPIAELFVEQRRRAEEAAAALEHYEAATLAADEANAKLAASLQDVNDYIKTATGLETVATQAARKRGEALREQADASVKATQEQIASAEAVKRSYQDEARAIQNHILLGKATDEERKRLAFLAPEIESINEMQKRRAARIEEVKAATEASVEFLALEAQANDHVARKQSKATASKSAATKASQDHAEALAREAERQRELDAIRSQAQSIVDSELTQQGRIIQQQADLRAQLEKNPAAYGEVTAAIAVLERQLQTLEDQEIEAYLKSQADAAKELQSAYEQLIPPEVPTRQEQFAALTAQVEQAFRDGIITFDEYQAKLAEIQTAQEETFNIEQFAAFFEGIKASTSQVFSDLESLSSFFLAQNESALAEAIKARKELGEDATKEEKDEAKKRVQAAREAAMRQFEITKALQIAQIVVNTAAAAAQALASSPPPFNLVAAAAAAAAGAVQLATVASTQPKFHKGGLIGQPDESIAVVRAGEAVLNPMGRKALGDEAIRAANAGALDHGGGAVQVVYKHKSFDYFVRDHLRTNATLPRALNAGRRLGHRGG